MLLVPYGAALLALGLTGGVGAKKPDHFIGVEQRDSCATESAIVSVQIDTYVSITDTASGNVYWPGDLTSWTIYCASPAWDFELRYYAPGTNWESQAPKGSVNCTLSGMPENDAATLELMARRPCYGLTGATSEFGIMCS